MLCPNCGTEVGDRIALCPNCAGRSSSAGSEPAGASLGAIRPNVKVVRLKPGEQPPPRDPVLPPEPPSGEAEPTLQESIRQAHQAERRVAPAAQPAPPPGRAKPIEFARVAGFFLIIAAAWALVILLRSAWNTQLDLRPAPPEPKQSFSHIVIHEKKVVVVDGTSVIGRFQIDDLVLALGASKAFWSPSKNSLELQFFLRPDQKEIEFNPAEPIVKLFLQFSPLKSALDREKLQSYMIEYLGEKEPLRIVKSFSVQLSAFGEVSPLSGRLKPGEKVRGSLRDTRKEEREGKLFHLNWELTFDTPLEIRR